MAENPPENVRDKIKEQLLLLHMGKKSVDIGNEENVTDVQSDLKIIDLNDQTSVKHSEVQTSNFVSGKLNVQKQNGVCTEKQSNNKSENVEKLEIDNVDTGETVLEDSKIPEMTHKRHSIIDSLINKFKLKNNIIDIKKPLKNETEVKSEDRIDIDNKSETIEISKKTINCKEDDESLSGDFFGFAENDIIDSKWTNPDILATPIAPNPNKSVFVSEDLDNFMRENSLDNINSCDVPNVFKYKPIIDGMVCDGSQPPMLSLPPRIESYGQKPRTLAEKRLLFKKKKDIRFLMMENQSSTYHAFTKRLKTNQIDKVVVESIQNQNVPFDRNCWQLISWLNTEYLKFYFQVLDVDGEVIKLIGGRGGYARKDFSRKQSSAPYPKYLDEPCPPNSACKKLPSHLKITVYNPDLDETFLLENNNSSSETNIEDNNIKLLYHKYENIDLKTITPGPLSRKCKKLNKIKDPKCNGNLEPYHIPHVELEVWPQLNYPLDPSVRPYLKMILPHTNITNDWAKFAVSTVQCKTQDGIISNNLDNDERKSHTFIIPFENDQKCIMARRIKTQFNDNKASTLLPSTSPVNLQKHKTIINTNLDDIFQNNDLMFMKNINKDNQIEVECGYVVEDMINTVAISLCENLFIENDPDINYNESNEENNLINKPQLCSTIDNGNNSNFCQANKIKMKNGNTKMLSELRKLNATIINASEDSVDTSDDEEICDNDYCKMGCVCNSLARKQSAQNRHCKKIDCIFQCKCLTNVNVNIKDDLTMEDLRFLHEKATKSLAKEEKEFSSTIIVKNNNTIIVQDPKKDSKRCKKAPKRFSDYQFTNDLYEKFSYEIIKNSNHDDKIKKLKNENLTLENNHIKNNNKRKVKLNLSNATHCSVKIRRLDWLEDLEPWCMIHCLYKCFCNCDALNGEPFSLTESITGVTMQQTAASTTDKDLIINTTIPRIRNFTFDSNAREQHIKSDKKQVAKKHNTKMVATNNKRHASTNDTPVSKRTRATPMKDIPKAPAPQQLSPSTVSVPIEESPMLFNTNTQVSNINTNDNLSAARLRKVATDYYIQRNRARRASVFKLITHNNNYENLKMILQKKIQDAIKYDTGKRKDRKSIRFNKCQSVSEKCVTDDAKAENTTTEHKEPIYISVDLNNIGNNEKPPMVSLLRNTMNSESTSNSATIVTATVATPTLQSLPKIQIKDNNNKNPDEIRSITNSGKIHVSNKSYLTQEVFINRFNNKVSLVMQRICDLLRNNITFDDLPEKNIINFLKWEHLINLYANDKIFIWLISKESSNILALTTVQCVPVADDRSNIVNIKAVSPNSFPLIAKLINLKIMTPKMKQIAVILYGCENYWRITGIFNCEKELNNYFIVKPTTDTHPNLASKIMRVRNLIALQQQQHQQQFSNLQPLTTEQQILESTENLRKIYSTQKLKSNVHLVPLTKEELNTMCVPIRIDSAHRWLVLTIYNDFSALYLPSRKCFIKHEVIMATIKLAQEQKKFVRINNISRIVPDIYGIPNSKNKIFLGPYDLRSNVDVVLCDTYNGEIVTRENYEHRTNKKHPNHTFGAWLILHRRDISSGNKSRAIDSNDNNSTIIKENGRSNDEESNVNSHRVNYNMNHDDDCIIIEDSSENGINMPIVIDDDDDDNNCIIDKVVKNEINEEIDISSEKEFINQVSNILPASAPFPVTIMKVTKTKDLSLKQFDKNINNFISTPRAQFEVKNSTAPLIDDNISKTTVEAPVTTVETPESVKLIPPINFTCLKNDKSNEKLIQLESGTLLKVKPMLQNNISKSLPIMHLMKTPTMSKQMCKQSNENVVSLAATSSAKLPTKDSQKISNVTFRFPPPLRCLLNKTNTENCDNKVCAGPSVVKTKLTPSGTTTASPTAISTSMTEVTTKKPLPSLKPFNNTNIPDIVAITKKLPASTSLSIEKIVNEKDNTNEQTVIDLTASKARSNNDEEKHEKLSDDPFKLERTGQFSFRILDSDIINDGHGDESKQEQQNSNKKKMNIKHLKRNSLLMDNNSIPRKLMKFSRKSLPNIIKIDQKLDPQQQSTINKNLIKELPPDLLLVSVNSVGVDNDNVVSGGKKLSNNNNNDNGKVGFSNDCDNTLNNEKKKLVKLIKVCDKSILKNNLYTRTSPLLLVPTRSLSPASTRTPPPQPSLVSKKSTELPLNTSKTVEDDNYNNNNNGEKPPRTHKRILTDNDNDSIKKFKTIENLVTLKKIVKTSDVVKPLVLAPVTSVMTPPTIGKININKLITRPISEITQNNKSPINTSLVKETVKETLPIKQNSKNTNKSDVLKTDNIIEILSDEELNVNVPEIRINKNKFVPLGFLISNIVELGYIPTTRQPNKSFILKLPKVTSLLKFQDLNAVNNYLHKYIRQHIYRVLFKKDTFSLKWHYATVHPSKYSVMNESTLNKDMILTQYGLINLTETLDSCIKECFIKDNLYLKYLLFKLGHILISPMEMHECNILEILKLAFEEIERLKEKSLYFDEEKKLQHRKNRTLLNQFKMILEKDEHNSNSDKLEKLKKCLIEDDMFGEFYDDENLCVVAGNNDESNTDSEKVINVDKADEKSISINSRSRSSSSGSNINSKESSLENTFQNVVIIIDDD